MFSCEYMVMNGFLFCLVCVLPQSPYSHFTKQAKPLICIRLRLLPAYNPYICPL